MRQAGQRFVGDALWPRRAVRLELPDERRERALRLDELHRAARIVDRRLDLPAVADDGRVLEEPLDVALAEAGDLAEVEPGEGAPERLALAQDRQPGEPGLEPLERELLEQPHVLGDREAPLVVVVGAVLRLLASSPAAADDAVLVPDEAVGKRHR